MALGKSLTSPPERGISSPAASQGREWRGRNAFTSVSRSLNGKAFSSCYHTHPTRGMEGCGPGHCISFPRNCSLQQGYTRAYLQASSAPLCLLHNVLSSPLIKYPDLLPVRHSQQKQSPETDVAARVLHQLGLLAAVDEV